MIPRGMQMKLKWITIGFGLFILAIIWLANGKSRLLAFAYEIPLGDKIGHFILIGTLALLINLTWPKEGLRIGRWPVFTGTLLLLPLVLLEEISQLWFPARTFSLFDLLFDVAGMLVLGEWLCRRLLSLKREPMPERASSSPGD